MPYSAIIAVMPVPPNKFSVSIIYGEIPNIPKPIGIIKGLSMMCCMANAHGYNLTYNADPSRDEVGRSDEKTG